MGPAFGRSSMGPFRRASMPGGRVDDAPPHAHPGGGGATSTLEVDDTPHPRSRTDEWRVIHTGAAPSREDGASSTRAPLRTRKRARTHTGAAPSGGLGFRPDEPPRSHGRRAQRGHKKKADRAPSVEAGSRGAASVS